MSNISCDNIFRSKEEFLFVFGGFNTEGFVQTTEVLDAKRGIWRKFNHCAPAKTQFAVVSMPNYATSNLPKHQSGDVTAQSIWIIGGRNQKDA